MTVSRQLEATGRELIEPFVFAGRPTLRADYDNVEALTRSLRAHAAIPVRWAPGR